MTTFATPPNECHPPLELAMDGGWDLEVRLPDLAKPVDFTALFGRQAPVEIEVGCGSGLYLAHDAGARPEVNFLGIERDYTQVRRAKDKWRRRGFLNTRIVHGDAHYFLEEFVAPASVDAYIILYSDPWPKKRHHKRRFFQPRLLPTLQRTMKPGGLLTVKTDVTSYYEVIAELLGGAPFLETIHDRRLDLEPDPDDIPTNFQSKAIEKGHPLHAMKYRRR